MCDIRFDLIERSKTVVLLLPGSGPLDIDGTVGPNKFLLQLSNGIAGRGISTVRFTKCSRDECRDFQNEYLPPARAALEIVRQHVPDFELAVVGHSLGGHVAPEIATTLSARAVVIINSHHSSLLSVLRWQLSKPHLADHGKDLLQNSIRRIDGRGAGSLSHLEQYLANSHHYSPAKHIRALSIPLLVVASGMDQQIPNSEFELFRSVANGKNAAFEQFDNLNHLLMPASGDDPMDVFRPNAIAPEALRFICRWIRREFRKKDEQQETR